MPIHLDRNKSVNYIPLHSPWIQLGTKYGFVSMWRKENPHRGANNRWGCQKKGL